MRRGSILEIYNRLIAAAVSNLRCGRGAEAVVEALRRRRRAAQRAGQALREGITEAHPARPTRVDLSQHSAMVTMSFAHAARSG